MSHSGFPGREPEFQFPRPSAGIGRGYGNASRSTYASPGLTTHAIPACQPSGIGREFSRAGRDMGTSASTGYVMPGLPPRRDPLQLNLKPEDLKLMEKCRGYVDFLRLRKKQIFDQKRERELADELEDIEFCLEVIQDVTTIEKSGVQILQQAYDMAVDLGNRHPIDVAAHVGELDDDVTIIEGQPPAPAPPPKAIPTPEIPGMTIETDFNYDPRKHLQDYGFTVPTQDQFPPPHATPGPEFYDRPQPAYNAPVSGARDFDVYEARLNELREGPPREWPQAQRYFGLPPVPPPPPVLPIRHFESQEYPIERSRVERSHPHPSIFAGTYSAGPGSFQQHWHRPPAPPSSLYNHSDYDYGGNSSYDMDSNYSEMNSFRYEPSQYRDLRGSAAYQQPPREVYRNPQNIHNRVHHSVPRFRSQFESSLPSPSRDYRRNPYQNQNSPPSSVKRAGPPSRRHEPSSTSPSASAEELSNITRDKAKKCFENFKLSKPAHPNKDLYQSIRRGIPKNVGVVRDFQPPGAPSKVPFKLNQPIQREREGSASRSALPTNQIPAEPRPNPAKKPHKNLQEAVERVKNSMAAKPPPRKSVLSDFRKEATHANRNFTRTKRQDPSNIYVDSEDQSDVTSEYRVESPLVISSNESSGEQDYEPTPKKQVAKKSSRKKTPTKSKPKTPNKSKSKTKRYPVIKLKFPSNSKKAAEARKSNVTPSPKKRKRSSKTRTQEKANKQRKLDKSSRLVPRVDENSYFEEDTSSVSAPEQSPFKFTCNRTAPRKHTSPRKPIVRSSTSSSDTDSSGADPPSHSQPSSLTTSSSVTSELVANANYSDDDKGYGYVERIVPKKRFNKNKDHLPQIPNVPNKPRVLGDADIPVNPWLVKIKMESDFQPLIEVKPEPMDVPTIPEDAVPSPPDLNDNNSEDLEKAIENDDENMEKQLEDIFGEKAYAYPETEPEENNVMLEEVDVPDYDAEGAATESLEQEGQFPIRIREFNTILEGSDGDDDDRDVIAILNNRNIEGSKGQEQGENGPMNSELDEDFITLDDDLEELPIITSVRSLQHVTENEHVQLLPENPPTPTVQDESEDEVQIIGETIRCQVTDTKPVIGEFPNQ